MAEVQNSNIRERCANSEKKEKASLQSSLQKSASEKKTKKKRQSLIELDCPKAAMGRITELELEESMANITPHCKLEGSDRIIEEPCHGTLDQL